ncbi:hypothetical protein [Pararhizobium sp. IMCC21322]|uniref:hypothetical protein n=1 Tax=Pararhizobium sp. IMCC21322 TaxID=3067903 RepID=UPI0027425DEE|nr:hypothetical protein [Pararhizobium sp. IMCC21322]
MFSIPALLLYILFFVVGWLFARWRGAQEQSRRVMAPAVSTPQPQAKAPEVAAKPKAVSTIEKEPAKAPKAVPKAKAEPEPKDSVSASDSQPIVKKEVPKEKKKAAKAASKPIVSSDPDKPERLSAPRDGDADDLKRVKGIGPANEKKLNAFGVYHFDQIANWSAEQAEWIGKELSFPGRIEREEWIEQAKVLASGGDTEFSKRSDKR